MSSQTQSEAPPRAPKIIELAKNGREFLAIDVAPGEDGKVRGSHWRPKEKGESAHVPPAQPFARMLELGAIPAKAKREAWVRFAFERETLDDLCFILFKDTRHEWRTVLEYLRSTTWGAELP